MRLIRSWPAQIPENRAYVVDGIERLVMSGFDYRCLADIDDDVILIEWDIAVGRDELETFIQRAREDPEQIRVAPYRLYPGKYRVRAPLWVHRVRDPGMRRFVKGPEDTHCQMFGFGLIYLPRATVLRYLKSIEGQPRAHFGDSEFSRWHMRHGGAHKNVPIDWDVPLVHLHYELPVVV